MRQGGLSHGRARLAQTAIQALCAEEIEVGAVEMVLVDKMAVGHVSSLTPPLEAFETVGVVGDRTRRERSPGSNALVVHHQRQE